jgi:hypothetical protein
MYQITVIHPSKRAEAASAASVLPRPTNADPAFRLGAVLALAERCAR